MNRFRNRPAYGNRRSAKPLRIAEAIVIVVLSIIVSNCSMDYRAAEIAQKLNENVPDLILYDFQHTSVRHNRKTFQISAKVSRSYDQKRLQELTDVTFLEFNDAGEVITHGTADSAILYSDTDNVKLSGHIHFYSKQEQATITCSGLFWNDKERTLTSGKNDVVTIHKDSGTELSGTGFSADAARNEVEFSGPVSGTVVTNDQGSSK